MVCLQTSERLFELPQRGLLVAAVRADLRHEEDFIPPAFERLAHQLLAAALVILPSVVHEIQPGVNRLVDYAQRLALRLHERQVVAAERERGDPRARAPQAAARNLPRILIRHAPLRSLKKVWQSMTHSNAYFGMRNAGWRKMKAPLPSISHAIRNQHSEIEMCSRLRSRKLYNAPTLKLHYYGRWETAC